MKIFDWSVEKAELLQKQRGVNFENVVWAIENGYLLAVVDSANQKVFSGQQSFVVNIDDYAYLVPFVEDKGIVFLKTIIPSRKATKMYLKGGRHG